jgi:hypothetical protein
MKSVYYVVECQGPSGELQPQRWFSDEENAKLFLHKKHMENADNLGLYRIIEVTESREIDIPFSFKRDLQGAVSVVDELNGSVSKA